MGGVMNKQCLFHSQQFRIGNMHVNAKTIENIFSDTIFSLYSYWMLACILGTVANYGCTIRYDHSYIDHTDSERNKENITLS